MPWDRHGPGTVERESDGYSPWTELCRARINRRRADERHVGRSRQRRDQRGRERGGSDARANGGEYWPRRRPGSDADDADGASRCDVAGRPAHLCCLRETPLTEQSYGSIFVIYENQQRCTDADFQPPIASRKTVKTYARRKRRAFFWARVLCTGSPALHRLPMSYDCVIVHKPRCFTIRYSYDTPPQGIELESVIRYEQSSRFAVRHCRQLEGRDGCVLTSFGCRDLRQIAAKQGPVRGPTSEAAGQFPHIQTSGPRCR